MHSETFLLPESSAEMINMARSEGRRIISVGTTSVRVLETTYRDGLNIPGEGKTDIFIYPPFKIKSIDGLITNFHTPKSTLLMLVSAFAGYDRLMNAYSEAVKREYRFFSYGDSMLIL
jgi:S-adenosylmethionine:tRNA ribosyltransferase-isomerase